MLDIDNLIDAGVQTTQDMQAKKGKNRNAKEIPFDIDGHTYMLDSQEEWCMFNWIKEMKEHGLLLDYVYQPEHWELTPRFEYTPYPTVVDRKKRPVDEKYANVPKPFKTKFLTSQLNCARLSFAEADKMQEYLHTIPGSVSALELIFDTDNNIQLVIDNDLMSDEYICGHPGINTSTVRLLREDMLKYVRAAKHEPTFIDLPTE